MERGSARMPAAASSQTSLSLSPADDGSAVSMTRTQASAKPCGKRKSTGCQYALNTTRKESSVTRRPWSSFSPISSPFRKSAKAWLPGFVQS